MRREPEHTTKNFYTPETLTVKGFCDGEEVFKLVAPKGQMTYEQAHLAIAALCDSHDKECRSQL